MKPSEYLYNEDFMVLNDTYKLKIIDKLDKQFIDREELKDKINKLKEFRIVENIDYGLKEGFGRITYIDVVKKDEILKLLE